MIKHKGLLPSLFVAGIIFALAVTSPMGWTRDRHEREIPFDEAEIFFELNNTDGDLGIHGKIDGGPWTRVKIEDPNGRTMMDVKAKGRLRRQAVTELFFESAEPLFDELDPEDFFKRFPEGTYEVEGRSQDRKELESETEVTHRMPAPADGITLNGVEDTPIKKERCDEDSNEFSPMEVEPQDDGTVTIMWEPVTSSHPDLGSPRSGDIVIHNYEVVVEVELELNGDEFVSLYSVILPPGKNKTTIPAEFIALGEEFKYEILAREESFNQTAVESCFVIED